MEAYKRMRENKNCKPNKANARKWKRKKKKGLTQKGAERKSGGERGTWAELGEIGEWVLIVAGVAVEPWQRSKRGLG
ncbi:unnamed protein product [Ilex paraguariensis]|uniref:Uncharacterized protein n=1 Tax=Ilex paraguariensis TaxID=185542 RepID=A0ABC8ULH5_9AQUA